eukprot:3880789-Amphidinium_carterae.1
MEASRQDDEAVVSLLLEHNADANRRDQYCRTARRYAPSGGRCCKLLAPEQDASPPHYRDMATGFVLQCKEVKLGTASRLPRPEKIVDEDGNNPLHQFFLSPALAVQVEVVHEQVLRTLLKYKTCPNQPNADLETPLMLAVRELGDARSHSHKRLLRMLLESRANLEIRNSD